MKLRVAERASTSVPATDTMSATDSTNSLIATPALILSARKENEQEKGQKGRMSPLRSQALRPWSRVGSTETTRAALKNTKFYTFTRLKKKEKATNCIS